MEWLPEQCNRCNLEMTAPGSEISRGRIRWELLLPLVIGASLLLRLILIENERFFRSLSPGCMVHRVTGLHCPGCGGTRAFFAFLKGDIATSWRMNPLFLSSVGIGLIFLILFITDRRWGRPKWLRWLRVSAKTGWWTLGFCLLFAILRNIPRWPFTLLAPY